MQGYVSDSLNTREGGKALWSNTVLLHKSHGTGGVTLANAECNVQADHVFLTLELKSKGLLSRCFRVMNGNSDLPKDKERQTDN